MNIFLIKKNISVFWTALIISQIPKLPLTFCFQVTVKMNGIINTARPRQLIQNWKTALQKLLISTVLLVSCAPIVPHISILNSNPALLAPKDLNITQIKNSAWIIKENLKHLNWKWWPPQLLPITPWATICIWDIESWIDEW